MKKLFVVFALLCLVVGFSVNVEALYGLNKYHLQIKDQRGIYGEALTSTPNIIVYEDGTTTQATIYANESGACMDNDYTADADGIITFWCSKSTIDIKITDSSTNYFQRLFEDIAPTDHQLIIPVNETATVSLTWDIGTDIASASTITLGVGTYFQVTGTTAIHYINPDDSWLGRVVYLELTDSVTIHNMEGASSATRVPLVLAHTGGDITGTIGDTLGLVFNGCMWVQITNND